MARAFTTIGRDEASTLCPPMTDIVHNYVLAAGVAQSVNWPENMKYCNINAIEPYAIRVGGTAAWPTVSVTDGTGSAINVSQRTRMSETSFSIVSPVNAVVSIEFWEE